MSATAELARFVVSCDSDSIPPAARDQVRRSLLDTLGTTLAGSVEPAGVLIGDFVVSQSAHGVAWLSGRPERTSPMLAALANGTMGHALDFDDGLVFGHPGVALVPATLAVAEQVCASGREVLDALVLGIEVAGRIALATSDEPYQRGYHGTPVFGVLGATAAVGRLLGLAEGQLRWALGIAGSLAGGVRANFGTMTKPLHAGECGRAAVEAAMLARLGFTASSDIVECRLGYGDTLLGRAEYDPAKMVVGLGVPFIAERGPMIKQYACCHCNHATLDGLFRILGEHSLDAADVAAVHIIGSSSLRDPLIYRHPASGLQGKFSLPYNIALALVDRQISRASYTDEHARDPRLAAVIDKVTVETVADWEPWMKVRIEIVTTKGVRIVHEQECIAGDEKHPLTWATIVSKFRDNAAVILADHAIEHTIALVENLERESSVHGLTSVLAARRDSSPDRR